MATKKQTAKEESVEEQSPKTNKPTRKLYRSEKDQVIAGVAGGLGEYLDIDPVVIRLLFVVVTLAGGSGVLLYIILWLVLPTENNKKLDSEEVIKENAREMRDRVQNITSELNTPDDRGTARSWTGILLVIVGLIFLLQNLGLPFMIDWGKFWPIILVIFGFLLISRR